MRRCAAAGAEQSGAERGPSPPPSPILFWLRTAITLRQWIRNAALQVVRLSVSGRTRTGAGAFLCLPAAPESHGQEGERARQHICGPLMRETGRE